MESKQTKDLFFPLSLIGYILTTWPSINPSPDATTIILGSVFNAAVAVAAAVAKHLPCGHCRRCRCLSTISVLSTTEEAKHHQ
jgi:hypothetical protein